METAKESAKVNGKAKGKKAQAPKPNGKEKPVVKPAEKPKTPEKESVWSLARNLLAQGKKDAEIKKEAHAWVMKNTDPQDALKFFAARMSYRALFRAKKTAKAGKEKGGAANAGK